MEVVWVSYSKQKVSHTKTLRKERTNTSLSFFMMHFSMRRMSVRGTYRHIEVFMSTRMNGEHTMTMRCHTFVECSRSCSASSSRHGIQLNTRMNHVQNEFRFVFIRKIQYANRSVGQQ